LDQDGAGRVALRGRPHVLQGDPLAVHGGGVAVEVRLKSGVLELLRDPDGHAVVGVGPGYPLREVLDDGAHVRRRSSAVERHRLGAELGGVGMPEREQGDDDEDEAGDPSGAIHLKVRQGDLLGRGGILSDCLRGLPARRGKMHP
jgi:hypothetical protein